MLKNTLRSNLQSKIPWLSDFKNFYQQVLPVITQSNNFRFRDEAIELMRASLCNIYNKKKKDFEKTGFQKSFLPISKSQHIHFNLCLNDFHYIKYERILIFMNPYFPV